MAYSLPNLPYDFSALEPHIDARTMEIHHGKHHQAYVTNLNNALGEKAGSSMDDLETLLRNISSQPVAVRNNGGGHWNHSMFWNWMTPGGASQPEGDLAERIKRDFGSLDDLKTAFNQAATTRFGSGWAWLVRGDDGRLFVSSTPNQDNPLMDVAEKQGRPILGIDVWEHAYYLNYQNRRPDYITAWWNTVNWNVVAQHLAV